MSQAEIVLSGLIGSNPLGALAAFGLLRVCTETPELNHARLSWRAEDDWIAVLTLPCSHKAESLMAPLAAFLMRRKFDVFNWSPDVRVQPQEYKERLIQQGEKARYCERLDADYYVAYASEMATDGSKGLVKPSALHMTSGQQRFLKSIYELGESLRNNSEAAIREALFGPWLYRDHFHSLGWDPMTERMYALRHRAPTSEAPLCVRAAVWFAVESLPLFPTAIVHGKLVTTGFAKQDGEVRFVWPIWTEPISLDSLKTLVATSELGGVQEAWRSLGRRGVTAVYGSVRSEFGQGYAILRPATLVWSAV